MKTMKFAEQFVPLIEQGLKTQTRRLIEPQPTGQIFKKYGCWGSAWFDAEWISGFEFDEIFSVNGTDLYCQIVNVRVERVQNISQEDVVAEGGPRSHSSIDIVSREFGYKDFSRSWFAQKWDSIYPGSWDRNDWVWVYEFKKVEV